MNDDDSVLVRGEPVDPETLYGDIEVEENGYATLGRGLVYAGFALFLSGPIRALQALPKDLTTVTASTFEPAVGNMMIGIVFIGVAAIITIASSGPVSRSLSRFIDWATSESEAKDPLTDGGGRDE